MGFHLRFFLFSSSMNNANGHILNSITETALVKECIAGNRCMQNRLYMLYASRMMGVCMRYAKSRQDAEEILQEGFIKVFTCLAQFKFRSRLETWIKKIMINCALQKLRDKHSMYPVLNIETVTDKYEYEDLIFSGIHEKELVALIQQLPPVCRIVFNLYVFEGMKHNEIAQLLQISEGTSKSNLFDARAILQRRLNEYAPAYKTKV